MTQKPLSDEELIALRDIMTADSRRQWLISGAKAVAIWIAAIAGGWLAFRQAITEFLIR